MFRSAKLIALLGCVAAVGACEEVPPGGPTVMALPSAGKNLTTFEQEDGQCRSQAATKIGNVSPGQAGAQAAVGSAAVGTVLGAAAGSAIGAAAGNAGAGAAIGGAAGLAGGAAIGANNATTSEGDLQMRYDIAYTQCMYSHGDTVQRAPSGGYGYYANVGYPYYGYPWYGWAGPVFLEVASSCFAGTTISIINSTGSMTASTGSILAFTVASMTEAGSTVKAGRAVLTVVLTRGLSRLRPSRTWRCLRCSPKPAAGQTLGDGMIPVERRFTTEVRTFSIK